jgi:hypothetical protein
VEGDSGFGHLELLFHFTTWTIQVTASCFFIFLAQLFFGRFTPKAKLEFWKIEIYLLWDEEYMEATQ